MIERNKIIDKIKKERYVFDKGEQKCGYPGVEPRIFSHLETDALPLS